MLDVSPVLEHMTLGRLPQMILDDLSEFGRVLRGESLALKIKVGAILLKNEVMRALKWHLIKKSL